MAPRHDLEGVGATADLPGQIKTQDSRLRGWLPLVFILAFYLALGVYYSMATPIWETPDEPGHFGNVQYIAKYRKLPEPGTFYTWHQSPLYHIIAAGVISGVDMSPLADWTRSNPNAAIISPAGAPNVALHSIRELPPYQDVSLAVHLARWVNLVFGAITVAITYLLALRLFPGQVWIAIGAASIVAFNSQFIFMSSAVQNDAPLAAAFALTLLPALNIVQGDRRPRQFLWLGAMAGLAIVFKQSGIVLIGLAGLVVLWAVWQSRRWQNLLQWGTLTTLALVAGPMYLRNTLLYGDPFAYQVYKSLHPPVAGIRLGEVTGEMYVSFFRRMHASFWGYFGWLTVPLPTWMYTALWLIYPLTSLGLVLWVWRGRWVYAQPKGGLPAVGLLVMGVMAVWAFTIRYTLSFGAFGVQGRYLFQMISALAILVSLGLFSLLPGRWRPVPIGITSLALLALAFWVPQGVIAPTYEYLGDPPQVLDSLQIRRDEVFGDAIELAGYELQPELETGKIQVALYWRTWQSPAEDYTIFVHLLDADGNRISQDDRRPMDGRFPTNLWRRGDIVHTDHVLQASQVCLQRPCYLAVGFYDWETGQRLSVTRGIAENNAVTLKEFLQGKPESVR
jgi:4-amino-4-deoxy-L-arabinose transferase-like glycosyltransferase